MTQALLINGRPAAIGGRNVSFRTPAGLPTLSNMGVPWTHSWDMRDAVTYIPSAGEQSEFGITSAPRVASVADPSGNKPLRRDGGSYGSPFSVGALPGPLYIPDSARFRRPGVRFDQVHSSPNLWAMLSPQAVLHDPADYFLSPGGLTPPYWGAFLVRPVAVPTGIIDSALGSDPLISAGMTIGSGNGLGSGDDWSYASWFDGGRTVNDMVTNGTTTITSATAAFVVGDVGKVVVGANLPSSSPYATIASRTNATTVVLSVPASGSGSSGALTISAGVLSPDGVVRSNHDQSTSETVLVVCSAAEGALQSSIFVYWRDASGIVRVAAGAGTVSTVAQQMAWRDLFIGWVGEVTYMSAAAIQDGPLDGSDLTALLAWVAPWLVATGSLPAEP